MADTSTWPLQDAKARLSELVERALTSGPQSITRRGKESVVVVAAEEYRRLRQPQGSLLDFLRSAPMVELEIERSRDTGRAVEL